ncbi:merozoite surface protein 3b [Pseudomonas sp. NCHU5208]|uniref:merozoite surface protein 3b n=1 Tax=unclassified Pseudomonas TaxID=196821 RepID=UPI003F99AB6C
MAQQQQITINYLERATAALSAIGINFDRKAEPAPVLALLEKLRQYDETKVTQIAIAMQQSSAFHKTVREQLGGLDVSRHYQAITDSFGSIGEDAKKMAGYVADGQLDWKEKLAIGFMKLRRGSIPERFDTIRLNYLQATTTVGKEIEREQVIRTAYQDFDLAMGQVKVAAEELLQIATAQLDSRRAALDDANKALEAAQASGQNGVAIAQLELVAQEALRAYQVEDKSYQICKDISEDLKVGQSTTRVIMAHLEQVATAKDRLHARMISFFAGQESVLTALSVAFTAGNGLAAATKVLEAQKAGTEAAIESLATTSQVAVRDAISAGYGAALSAHPVKMLGEAVVQLQSDMVGLIRSARESATSTVNEIESATIANERAFAAIVAKAG